jgi:hypothetical protein
VTNRGEEVVTPLSYSSSNTSVATIDQNGFITSIANGVFTILVELPNDPTIQDSIDGTVQFTVQDNYTIELLEPAYITKNTTKTFTAVVKNNGIVDANKFVIWDAVYADDKISQTALVTMISNSTTQITLKGNASGFVQLKVKIIGLTEYHWIRMQVKGLI